MTIEYNSEIKSHEIPVHPTTWINIVNVYSYTCQTYIGNLYSYIYHIKLVQGFKYLVWKWLQVFPLNDTLAFVLCRNFLYDYNNLGLYKSLYFKVKYNTLLYSSYSVSHDVWFYKYLVTPLKVHMKNIAIFLHLAEGYFEAR